MNDSKREELEWHYLEKGTDGRNAALIDDQEESRNTLLEHRSYRRTASTSNTSGLGQDALKHRPSPASTTEEACRAECLVWVSACQEHAGLV